MPQIFRIGSSPDCDVVIADASVLPVHLEIELSSGSTLSVVNRAAARQTMLIQKGNRVPLIHETIGSGDALAIGEVTLSFDELVEGIRYKHPDFQLKSSAGEGGRARQGRLLPSLRKKALLIGGVAALVLCLFVDRSKQLSQLEYYHDQLELMRERIKIPTVDITSLDAVSARLSALSDEMIISSWRWIGDEKKQLLEAVQIAKQQVEDRKKLLGGGQGARAPG